MSNQRDARPTRGECIVAVLTAVALTAVFWPGLWRGEGLIGGDTYSYYFPQKIVYAKQLADGDVPLWNPLAGHGYPLLAESQTGVFSPFNLICFRLLSVNTAYNVVQLVHYAICFVFTWLFVRRIGRGQTAALFAGLVFTYAWFPYRVSLEWAMTTGAWLPAALWCTEAFLQSRRWRYALLLAVVTAVQLLAGHFHLAFLTHLTLMLYVPGRLWFANAGLSSAESRWKSAGVCAAAMAFGYSLAAVQLAPSWELKERSQRASVGQEQDLGFGHTPVWYWSQAVVPWMWYGIDADLNSRLPEGDPGTNETEAHLYFGLIPLALVVVSLFVGVLDRSLWLWLLLGVAALFYTPGWLLPIAEHLPGFSFFLCPGRYSLITTLAVAVVAAATLDRLTRRMSRNSRGVVFACAFGLTMADLWLVAGQVFTPDIVPDPPINNIEQSPVHQILQKHDQPVRLFSPGANLPTMMHVSSTPLYLGFGPAEYFDPKTAMPQPLPFDTPPTPAHIAWLRRAGVTHVLSFSALGTSVWPVDHIWSGHDAFLNRAWGRRETLHLYELTNSRGRVAWTTGNSGTVRVEDYGPNTVRISTAADRAGRVVLTDLAYPGWEATLDGEPVPTQLVDGMYRGVDVPAGRHEIVWRYRPLSFKIGLIVSLGTVVLLTGIAVCRFRYACVRSTDSDQQQEIART